MKMHELLSDPSKWTQGAVARDYKGKPVYPDHEEAVCWCPVGAAQKCYPEYQQALEVGDRIRERIYGEPRQFGLPQWNDAPGRTFEEVRQVLLELDV